MEREKEREGERIYGRMNCMRLPVSACATTAGSHQILEVSPRPSVVSESKRPTVTHSFVAKGDRFTVVRLASLWYTQATAQHTHTGGNIWSNLPCEFDVRASLV